MGNDISVSESKQSVVSLTSEFIRQNTKKKKVEDEPLIWLDSSIQENDADFRCTIAQLQRVVNTIGTFIAVDDCIEFIKTIDNENKINMIVSGSLGELIVPQIHEMTQINAIFIFCGNKEYHRKWSKKWLKVRDVFTEISPLCVAIKQIVKQSEENAISIKFMATSDNTCNKELNRVHYSFMYTQILKEILLSIQFEKTHIQSFISYCRQLFADSKYELENIREFEEKYTEEYSIWWYTRECFLYKILNRSLRLMNNDLIIKMGFFINDLHRQIEQLHSKQFHQQKPNTTFIVYRGQCLSRVDFEQLKKTKGGLMSFNNFLSTSKNRRTSLDFAENHRKDSNMVGVLFIMTIDPSASKTPFASITDDSYFKNQEEEILFSMHTVFRTHDIQLIDQDKQLFQVELTLTSDDDKDLRLLTECIIEETKGSNGWHRMTLLLIKLGQTNKAQEICESMLTQTTDEAEQAHLCYAISYVKENKEEDTLQKTNSTKVPLDRQLSLSSTGRDSIESCIQSGTVYYDIRKYSMALLFYEKALEIQQTLLPSNHSKVAISYMNVGKVYNKLGNYSKALVYHEKALGIQRQTLPDVHPDLAMCNYHIGTVFENMLNYSRAFFFYERAANIMQHLLPQLDCDLKECWRKRLERVRKRCNFCSRYLKM